MEYTVQPGANVLLDNLIALNASLFKENKQKNQQLIEMKKKLKDVEEAATLRFKVEEYEKELRNKNIKIEQLTSKLQLVRKLTEDVSSVDNIDTKITPILDQEGRICQANSTITTRPSSSGSSSFGQQKISHFFANGSNDTEAKSGFKQNVDPNTDEIMDGIDDQEEKLLFRLPERKVSMHRSAKKVSRPFVCTICSNTYIRLDHLKRHVRNKHPDSNEEKFKIPKVEANTGNDRKGSLTCDHCDTKFSHYSSLRRHNRNRHQVK